MALVKCPDCGKEFSDLAAACPNCGRPHRVSPAPESPKQKTSFAAWGCVTIIVLMVIGIATGNSGSRTPSSTEPSSAPAASNESSDFALQYTAEQTIKSVLKDPESASFQNEFVAHNGGLSTVCGDVNAKNGFGGFTGFTHFMADTAETLIRSEDNATQFRKRWNRLCAGTDDERRRRK